MSLAEVLRAVLSTGIGGTLAFYILNRPRFEAWPREAKAAAAFGIAALLCVAAFAAQVVMGYAPAPVDWRGWVEALVPVIAWAYTVSQALFWGDKARNKA